MRVGDHALLWRGSNPLWIVTVWQLVRRQVGRFWAGPHILAAARQPLRNRGRGAASSPSTRRGRGTRFSCYEIKHAGQSRGRFQGSKRQVKEKTGKATGNPDLHDRGTAEKTGGKVQRKVGDIKKVFEK
jgi:uncharacterized protein YjbJ (UPF0337 family)